MRGVLKVEKTFAVPGLFLLPSVGVFQKVVSITVHFGKGSIAAQCQHWEETLAWLLAVVTISPALHTQFINFSSRATVSGSRVKSLFPLWVLDTGFRHPSPTPGSVQWNFTSWSSDCCFSGWADARVEGDLHSRGKCSLPPCKPRFWKLIHCWCMTEVYWCPLWCPRGDEPIPAHTLTGNQLLQAVWGGGEVSLSSPWAPHAAGALHPVLGAKIRPWPLR